MRRRGGAAAAILCAGVLAVLTGYVWCSTARRGPCHDAGEGVPAPLASALAPEEAQGSLSVMGQGRGKGDDDQAQAAQEHWKRCDWGCLVARRQRGRQFKLERVAREDAAKVDAVGGIRSHNPPWRGSSAPAV